jgi:hypothetical protein
MGELRSSVCKRSYVPQVTGHERTTFAPCNAMLKLGPGSTTRTWKLHWLLLPLAFVAVHVT